MSTFRLLLKLLQQMTVRMTFENVQQLSWPFSASSVRVTVTRGRIDVAGKVKHFISCIGTNFRKKSLEGRSAALASPFLKKKSHRRTDFEHHRRLEMRTLAPHHVYRGKRNNYCTRA